jgi:hypothetical protein
MIAEGADGLSIGLLNEGVLAGEAMLTFVVPFHLSACVWSPDIYEWVSSWADEKVLLLKPEDWFERAMIVLEER